MTNEKETRAIDEIAKIISRLYCEIAADKQIGLAIYSSQLADAMSESALSFFAENKRMIVSDLDREFWIEVIRPALSKVGFSGVKYSGFGPRSIKCGLKKLLDGRYGYEAADRAINELFSDNGQR